LCVCRSDWMHKSSGMMIGILTRLGYTHTLGASRFYPVQQDWERTFTSLYLTCASCNQACRGEAPASRGRACLPAPFRLCVRVQCSALCERCLGLLRVSLNKVSIYVCMYITGTLQMSRGVLLAGAGSGCFPHRWEFVHRLKLQRGAKWMGTSRFYFSVLPGSRVNPINERTTLENHRVLLLN
jgi:hypothetical protein